MKNGCVGLAKVFASDPLLSYVLETSLPILFMQNLSA